jgi:hypothetical protein
MIGFNDCHITTLHGHHGKHPVLLKAIHVTNITFRPSFVIIIQLVENVKGKIRIYHAAV